jgi:hypothetical protein
MGRIRFKTAKAADRGCHIKFEAHARRLINPRTAEITTLDQPVFTSMTFLEYASRSIIFSPRSLEGEDACPR